MITYNKSVNTIEALFALNMLKGLENYYPGFEYWFINKVIPGLVLEKDIMILAKENSKIIGVSLCKKGEENKLRCVRVLPEYQNKGIGLHLVEKSLKEMNVDKPLCTVSEEMFHLFSRPFINMFNFQLTEVQKGLYRKGKLEYIFNK